MEEGRMIYHAMGEFDSQGAYLPTHANELRQYTHKLAQIEFQPNLTRAEDG